MSSGREVAGLWPASAIARQLGVSASTVRVWRHRYSDFPEAAHHWNDVALYRPSEIREWAARHARGNASRRGGARFGVARNYPAIDRELGKFLTERLTGRPVEGSPSRSTRNART